MNEILVSERATQRTMLRDSVVRFLRDSEPIARMRRMRATQPGFDRNVWTQMAEFGWLAILIPEDYGGLGLGFTEMSIVLEQLAKGLTPEPVISATVLAGRAISHGENETLKQELLSGLATGELIPALAWQEDVSTANPETVATSAVSGSSGYRLSGNKHFVHGTPGADGFVVSATKDGEPLLCWVPADANGITIQPRPLADGRFCSSVEFNEVTIDRDHFLAVGPAARQALDCAINETLIMIGSELCGVMSSSLELSISYLKTRVQFGKPIGSFQALQHRVVDLQIQNELSMAAVTDSVTLLDNNPAAPRNAVNASRVKTRCGNAALQITRESIQLHGAIGFTDEYDAGLYLKRALVLSAWLGNSNVHRRRYFDLTQNTQQE